MSRVRKGEGGEGGSRRSCLDLLRLTLLHSPHTRRQGRRLHSRELLAGEDAWMLPVPGARATGSVSAGMPVSVRGALPATWASPRTATLQSSYCPCACAAPPDRVLARHAAQPDPAAARLERWGRELARPGGAVNREPSPRRFFRPGECPAGLPLRTAADYCTRLRHDKALGMDTRLFERHGSRPLSGTRPHAPFHPRRACPVCDNVVQGGVRVRLRPSRLRAPLNGERLRIGSPKVPF